MWLNKAAQFLSRLFYPVSRIMNGVGGGILAAMMFLTAADVTLRYLFRRPITSSYELTELMMAILVIFGLAYVTLRKEHIRIDFITSRFSPRIKTLLDCITTLMSTGVLALITWQSIRYGELSRIGGDTTTILHIPIYPFIWLVALGFAVYCLTSIADLFSTVSQLTEKGRRWANAGLLLVVLVVALLFTMPALGNVMLQVSPFNAGLIGVCVLIVLLFAGMNIGLAMALLGFLGMAYVSGIKAGLPMMGTSPFSTASQFSFSVIPMFMLMGVFCSYSGMMRDFYYTMHKWLGRLPGGLAMATIGGCAGFAAVCGSSTATVVTLGTVALPEMKKYRYDSKLATGAIAAGGCIGVMIPPSTILIIYGILTEQSIGKLFLAGFIPGITEAIFYIITIYILCKRNPHLGPPSTESVSFTQKLASLKDTWGVLVLFLLVLGGIYMGVFTPSEAAGVGAFVALIFALGRRSLSWKAFRESVSDTAKNTAMCFIILIGAMIFNYFLAVSRLPFELSDYVSALAVNRYVIIGVIIVIYLVLGCIMSGFAIIILTVPIFFPIIVSLGFNPIWFGIITTRMTEIGQITPPVGINVFVMQGVAKDVPMSTIFRGITPFLYADFIHVCFLVAFPQISLFIPSLMK